MRFRTAGFALYTVAFKTEVPNGLITKVRDQSGRCLGPDTYMGVSENRGP